jgi:hypothetical protein
MPVLFFFGYLVGVQLVLGVLLYAVTLAITWLPAVRSCRDRLIGAVKWGAPGGFVGAVTAYCAAMFAGWLICKRLPELSASGVGCTMISVMYPWLLWGGYVVGSLWAGVIGWQHAVTRARTAQA